MMQKTEHKLSLIYSYYKLCVSLLPLPRPDYSSLIVMMTYGLFAKIDKALLTSRKKKKKIQQEMESQEVELLVKVKLFPDNLVTSIEESNSSVQPFTQP